ncbi:hypothetical protein QBC47DRAFT_226079 [Echria macrotheca]|uniref:Uncharacterized protein n=1 Tax=Echria macrotheca TaxID=438768 RepID=A0AAJ0BAM3_9PEZI|nr:hypothetical protein QBC47DRAFT_226079 [Echria macrotheca]
MSPFLGADGGFGGWLESRGDGGGFGGGQRSANMSGNGGVFQSAANNSATQQMFFNEFRFAAAKSIRTSTIILATFNTIAAFATAVGILFDGYYRQKRNCRTFSFRRNGFSFVPEGEVFPLVLSLCIVVQGITFAVAQSTGLDALIGTGCTLMGQLMFPAVFLAPYTQLVFGIEMAIRALRKDQPFAPRAKWTVTICLAIIGLLTLINFLVANFDRAPNFCLTSLFWFVAHWSTGCFALLAGIVSTLLVCVAIIFIRLTRSIKIEVTARVSASRTVYYLALAIVSNTFLIPYFFYMSFIDPRGGPDALNLAMVASVVANVTGLMTGGLYLFLKSNTISTIGPRDKVGEYQRRKMKYKIRRADDPDPDGHMLNYVRGQRNVRRVDSEASLISLEKEEEFLDENRRPASSVYEEPIPNPLRSHSVYPMPKMPRAPEPAQFSAMGHIRKRSFSRRFTSGLRSSKSSVTLLPATTYSPNSSNVDLEGLKPPPSMRNLVSGRHRRDSSLVSSATVQIGLRLSSVDDMPPITNNKVVVDTKVYHLDCPKVRDKEKDSPVGGRPMAITTPISSPTEASTVIDDTPKRNPVKDKRMKTLPPVPNPNGTSDDVSDDDDDNDDEPEVKENEITLSPNVYSPQSPTKAKIPSPKGVGFTVPSTSDATAKRSNSSRSQTKATPKPDWI